MKPEIADIWTDALLSDEYKQGKQLLHYKDSAGKEYFCCLGVLCDLAVKAGVDVQRIRTGTEGVFAYNGRDSFLPKEVMEWAGLESDVGYMDNGYNSLAGFNDGGSTFAELATVIKDNVDIL